MPTFTVDSKDRLDRFLVRMMPEESRSRLAKWIDEEHVTVNGVQERSSFTVLPGMVIEVDAIGTSEPHDLSPADIPLEIMYEDEHLLVVNKPRGLATHPAASLKEPSLVNALLGRGSTLSEGSAAYRPGIVHRLDKETTGLLVVAKTDQAHANLAKQIEGKSAERTYLAIVGGVVPNAPTRSSMDSGPSRSDSFSEKGSAEFTISAPIARDKHNRLKMAVDPKGKPAITHVRVLKKVAAGTLVECRLETGRTHQIRVHLRSLGLPVIGDTLYAPKEFQTAPLQLHAFKLSFDHPVSGVRIEVQADPPADFLG